MASLAATYTTAILPDHCVDYDVYSKGFWGDAHSKYS